MRPLHAMVESRSAETNELFRRFYSVDSVKTTKRSGSKVDVWTSSRNPSRLSSACWCWLIFELHYTEKKRTHTSWFVGAAIALETKMVINQWLLTMGTDNFQYVHFHLPPAIHSWSSSLLSLGAPGARLMFYRILLPLHLFLKYASRTCRHCSIFASWWFTTFHCPPGSKREKWSETRASCQGWNTFMHDMFIITIFNRELFCISKRARPQRRRINNKSYCTRP